MSPEVSLFDLAARKRGLAAVSGIMIVNLQHPTQQRRLVHRIVLSRLITNARKASVSSVQELGVDLLASVVHNVHTTDCSERTTPGLCNSSVPCFWEVCNSTACFLCSPSSPYRSTPPSLNLRFAASNDEAAPGSSPRSLTPSLVCVLVSLSLFTMVQTPLTSLGAPTLKPCSIH